MKIEDICRTQLVKACLNAVSGDNAYYIGSEKSGTVLVSDYEIEHVTSWHENGREYKIQTRITVETMKIPCA